LKLALEIIQNDDNTEILGGIWDYREDEEGIIYEISNSNIERKNRFIKNKQFIDNELLKRLKNRKEIISSDIEPIN
jgi:hypothetical protein